MTKLKKILTTILNLKIVLIFLFISIFIFFILASIFLSKGHSEYYEKPAILAGYKSASLADVHFLLYPDSTFFFPLSDKGPEGYWERISDTLVLKQNDTIQAILVNNKPIKIINPIFTWLEEMEFIENSSPKVVTFPSE